MAWRFMGHSFACGDGGFSMVWRWCWVVVVVVFECNNVVGCNSHGGLGEMQLGLLGRGRVRKEYWEF